ncbi:Secreted RxLR effector peptide protein, Avr3a [Phytophthora palmivora]|uniref:RxLR effector protein n=1 Tax=Phytophthora palmivora TaxID=4796 RepID=A0A2P4XVA7_9STRA|nr:Secreted RxLR effector peptide protein, Avr3a [Phytophthora palmivora]
MRLASFLSATMVAIYFAACSATTDFDQINVLMNGSPGHSHASTGKRLLRAHQENEASTEERTPNINFNLAQLTERADAKKLAKQLMGNDKLAKAAYIWWQHNGVTLTKLDDFLKLASRKTQGRKYDQIYNAYMMHLGYTGV